MLRLAMAGGYAMMCRHLATLCYIWPLCVTPGHHGLRHDMLRPARLYYAWPFVVRLATGHSVLHLTIL